MRVDLHREHDEFGCRVEVGHADVRVQGEQVTDLGDTLLAVPVDGVEQLLRQRRFLDHDAQQLWALAVVVDRVADQGPDRRCQGARGQVEFVGLGPGTAVDVPQQQRGEDRVLVRKVLVQRSDGDPGPFGDAVRGAGGVAVLGENVSSGGQDAFPGELGPHLARLATRLKTTVG